MFTAQEASGKSYVVSRLFKLVAEKSLFSALVTLLLLAPLVAPAQESADRNFENIAERFVNTLPELSPVDATLLGDHRRDDEIDDVSRKGRERRLNTYAALLRDLAAIDKSALSRRHQVDADMLQNELNARIWNIAVFEEWAWNPLYYVNIAGSSIYGLLAREFAPVEERLGDVAARLDALPEFLRQTRGELQPERVPKIHAETAISQNQGIVTIIDGMLLPLLEQSTPEAQLRLNGAIETAKDALAEHQSWLEDDLLPRAAGDFRIGARMFDSRLKFALNSPMSRTEIRRRAESEYEFVRNAMYDIARNMYAARHPYATFPDTPDEAFKQVIIRAALELAYLELPTRDNILELARNYLQQATAFVIEKNLVTVPDEPIEIIVMPEFQRGVSLAYFDPAGPLDRGQKSFYAVAPLPSDWDGEQVHSFLREYNTRSMQNLTIHEGMPGHFLQLTLSNRYPSLLRAMLASGPFIEGWAVYAEKVMADAGYLDADPLMKLMQLKWYLRAITNAIIDQAVHVDSMNRDEAMRLMIEGGFQEEREAAGKWVRAQLTSTQLSTYFVGYQEHIDMRSAVEAAWGDEFTLRRFHDQALSYGSPSVKYVRALILDERIPRDEE
jgi:uncharacterized protein (DUF885 family)